MDVLLFYWKGVMSDYKLAKLFKTISEFILSIFLTWLCYIFLFLPLKLPHMIFFWGFKGPALLFVFLVTWLYGLKCQL